MTAICNLSQVERSSALFEGIKIFAATLLLALASQIVFVIPYTPVLVTFQTAALLLIGYSLGPVKGALAVLLYLAEGLMGLPVFAFGQSALAVLMGPKGGYYLGFVLTAYFSGFAKQSDSFSRLFSIFTVAIASTFFTGLLWLSFWVGASQALALGLYPFVLGDFLKVGAMASLIKARDR